MYLEIFKEFLDKETWEKYKTEVDVEFLRTNYPELLKIYNVYDSYHKNEATNIELHFFTQYPSANKELYLPIFRKLNELPSGNVRNETRKLLEALRTRSLATKAAFSLLDFAEGKREEFDRKTLLDLQESFLVTDSVTQEEKFVEDDIESLYNVAIKERGLNWRLASLDKSLGPLRKGDFGFVFARPESGKTSFLASEVSHFATQTDKPIIWINNEEQGEKVAIRCYEASLGEPLEAILANKERSRELYFKNTGRRIKIKDDAGASRDDIERICKRYEPALVVVDQLDKVQGFDGDREDLRMGAIYQWAREIAKTYCPVIGICQADGSGEGVKYLTMGNVSNAKTAKQAEADWILGIGLSYEDAPNVRGFSICKNKLIGGESSLPSLRHGRWEVLLQPEIARYVDTV